MDMLGIELTFVYGYFYYLLCLYNKIKLLTSIESFV